jgi:hypothetical protein
MSESKERISMFSLRKTMELLPALVLLLIAQLVSGCAAATSSGSHTGTQPTALSITSGSIPSAQVQTAYTATLTATGGTAPYTWSLASGALPAGLSLSGSGGISGRASQAGSSSFTVQVVDSSSPVQKASKPLSITVMAGVASVQITTTSAPSGQVGTAYSTTFAATGGTTPYHWSISSGTLPAGLTLSTTGTVSGTPTTAGNSSFTIKVNDSSSPASTASGNFSITIAAAGSNNYGALLRWTASSSTGITGYNVYRSTVSGSGYVSITSSPIAGLTYTDTTVTSGQTYSYVITSIDASGEESTYSDEVQAVIP